MRLFLDIETIGTTDPAVIADIAAGITAPATMSKPETIAVWEAEKKPALVDEAVRKTAFDGGLGQVVCIGYAVELGDPKTIAGESEADLLLTLTLLLPSGLPVVVVGHNVGWDVRFLWQRFIVNGIPPPAWLRAAAKAKPWETADTMLLWNPERDRKTSLDKLCRMLGVPTPKTDMDGSQVWDAFKAGEMDKIATYCRGDVAAMRECFMRMAA